MVYSVKELLDTSSQSTLILSDIYRTMQDAMRKKLVAVPDQVAVRFGPESIPGSALSVKLQDKETLAFAKKGEGAKAWEDNESYSTLTYTPVQYAADIVVTDEMKEDSLFDVVRLNSMTAAYEAARKLDSLFFYAVETGAAANSSTHVVTGAADITVANITAAMTLLEADDHTPTDFDVCVAHVNDIRQLDTFVEADKAGVTNPSESLIGRIYGMNVYRTNNNYTTDVSYVLDRNYAIALAEKRPYTVRQWEDVRSGTSGFTASFRADLAYLRKEACSYIT